MNDPAAHAPILFFDSGLGGLTVLGPTRALLPTAPIVYAADYAGLPYGEKSDAELAARVPALLGRLVERYQPRLAVIACNTASTIALAHVRAALDLPIVGTVPAIKPAAEMTETGVIGVLIGVVGQQVLPDLIDQPVSISLLATLGALGTSLALGIGFGVYPASRAARLTPIDALRSE